MIEHREIGQRIELRRKDLNLTLADVAVEVGVAASTIQRYEKGQFDKIKMPVIEAIAAALHVNPEWLIGETDDPVDYEDGELSASIPRSYMEFKDILKSRRAALSLTLDEVAQKVGVSGATVSRWENGDIENVRRDKIGKLAEVLQVTPAYLMGWPETGAPVAQDMTEEMVILNRAAKNMTPEQRQRLLDMAKLMFKEEFEADDQ